MSPPNFHPSLSTWPLLFISLPLNLFNPFCSRCFLLVSPLLAVHGNHEVSSRKLLLSAPHHCLFSSESLSPRGLSKLSNSLPLLSSLSSSFAPSRYIFDWYPARMSPEERSLVKKLDFALVGQSLLLPSLVSLPFPLDPPLVADSFVLLLLRVAQGSDRSLSSSSTWTLRTSTTLSECNLVLLRRREKGKGT